MQYRGEYICVTIAEHYCTTPVSCRHASQSLLAFGRRFLMSGCTHALSQFGKPHTLKGIGQLAAVRFKAASMQTHDRH